MAEDGDGVGELERRMRRLAVGLDGKDLYQSAATMIEGADLIADLRKALEFTAWIVESQAMITGQDIPALRHAWDTLARAKGGGR